MISCSCSPDTDEASMPQYEAEAAGEIAEKGQRSSPLDSRPTEGCRVGRGEPVSSASSSRWVG